MRLLQHSNTISRASCQLSVLMVEGEHAKSRLVARSFLSAVDCVLSSCDVHFTTLVCTNAQMVDPEKGKL